MTKMVLEVKTSLTDAAIAERVAEVKDYDRFTVFKFTVTSEQHQLEVATADGVIVTSKDGSTYFGEVVDWDDGYYYVNLR